MNQTQGHPAAPPPSQPPPKAGEKKSRRPKTKRVDEKSLPPFSLMKRDEEIIQAVAEYRVLTSAQLATLFSASQTNGKAISSRLQNRLKLLFHYGYVYRGEQLQRASEGTKPLLYFLDTKGAELIGELTGEKPAWSKKENTLSDPHIAHVLATNDIRIAFVTSAKRNGYSIEEWIDERELKSPQMKDTVTIKNDAGNTAKTAIVPDGYFKLIVPAATPEGKRRVFRNFIECDMGTMTATASVWGRRDYRHKILAYNAYYNSGLYEGRYGGKTMRVLTVTTSPDRLNTLKDVTEKAGGKSRFWLTTFQKLKAADGLTAAIWEVATLEGLHSLTELGPA